jgi:hypothetical protein
MQRVSSLRFTPHPHPLSPSRGEGSPRPFNTPKPTPIPLSPGGEGLGGEGAIPLPTPPQRPQDTANPASSLHCRCSESQLGFTPHPRPLSPSRWRGEPCAPLTPPNPHQSPLSPWGRGVGGEGAIPLPTPPQRLQDTANAASSRTVDAASLSCVSPLTPAPSPLPGAQGSPVTFKTPKPTPIPLSPGGRGRVRGNCPFQPLLNAPRTPRIQHPCDCPCGVSQLGFTPHPRPLSLPGGEGSPRTFNTPKPTPIPLPHRGRGVRGEGHPPSNPSLNASRDTANAASLRTVDAACLSSGFTPHPRPLSPSRGEGSPAPLTPSNPHQSPSPPSGEGSGVRGQSPFQPLLNAPETPRMQHPRAAVDAASLSCVSPLTPAPSPLPGARGARALLTPPNPHQSPLSPIGERGRWCRGQSPFQPLLNAPRTPRIQHPRALSMRRVSVAFHPSPRPLSPSRGEGSPRTFNTPKPTPIPPPPPGRGVGGEGAIPLPTPPQRPRDTANAASSAHCRCSESQLRFTPHPRPLSPSRGEGSPCTFNTPKPTPIPPLPLGERGRW